MEEKTYRFRTEIVKGGRVHIPPHNRSVLVDADGISEPITEDELHALVGHVPGYDRYEDAPQENPVPAGGGEKEETSEKTSSDTPSAEKKAAPAPKKGGRPRKPPLPF